MAMTEPRLAVGYYFLNDHDTLPPQLEDERAMAHFSTYLDDCSFRRICAIAVIAHLDSYDDKLHTWPLLSNSRCLIASTRAGPVYTCS